MKFRSSALGAAFRWLSWVAGAACCGCGSLSSSLWEAAPDDSGSAVNGSSDPSAATPRRIRVVERGADPEGAQARRVFVVEGLSPGELEAMDALATADGAAADSDTWPRVFSVAAVVDGIGEEDVPSVAGAYAVEGEALAFTPRFRLSPGGRYVATYRPVGLGAAGLEDATALRLELDLPKPPRVATTVVERVYPSVGVLPENQLKFYIHFSAPMAFGHAYEYVELRDAAGRAIPFAFLEVPEELWDPEGRRLTIFFDPGRVKRELRPHEELGPALVEGRRFTFVVDGEWPDAAGNPLASAYRKEFLVGPPDYTSPDITGWALDAPRERTLDALRVRFAEPLDHGLLERVLRVVDPDGHTVGGDIETDDGERRWSLRPDRPWSAGEYTLEAETILEDLAGNNLERPFEVDIFERVERTTARTVGASFRPVPDGIR